MSIDVCPNCKTTFTSLTNICLNCGYDLEAGETAVTPKRPSKISPRAEFCRKYNPFAFPVAGLISLGLLILFLAKELDSPGMSFAVGLFGMTFLVTISGAVLLFQDHTVAPSVEERRLGWTAVVLSLLALVYVVAFFKPWLIVSLLLAIIEASIAVSLEVSSRE